MSKHWTWKGLGLLLGGCALLLVEHASGGWRLTPLERQLPALRDPAAVSGVRHWCNSSATALYFPDNSALEGWRS